MSSYVCWVFPSFCASKGRSESLTETTIRWGRKCCLQIPTARSKAHATGFTARILRQDQDTFFVKIAVPCCPPLVLVPWSPLNYKSTRSLATQVLTGYEHKLPSEHCFCFEWTCQVSFHLLRTWIACFSCAQLIVAEHEPHWLSQLDFVTFLEFIWLRAVYISYNLSIPLNNPCNSPLSNP